MKGTESTSGVGGASKARSTTPGQEGTEQERPESEKPRPEISGPETSEHQTLEPGPPGPGTLRLLLDRRNVWTVSWTVVAVIVILQVLSFVENLTIEPRISGRAVEVHPAASFGAVMLGASLFGVAGAFIAVPMAALILALTEIYARKYDLSPRVLDSAPSSGGADAGAEPQSSTRGLARWLPDRGR